MGREKTDFRVATDDARRAECDAPSQARRRLTKAIYVAPVIAFLGTISELADGQTAQSCDPATNPFGCPPPPP